MTFLTECASYPLCLAAGGEMLFVIHTNVVLLYDLQKEQVAAKQDEVLSTFFSGRQEELINDKSSLLLYSCGSEVYVLTHDGLFSHKLYGETMDCMVDGGECSISDIGRGFAGMAVTTESADKAEGAKWELLFSSQGFLNRLLETYMNFLGEKSAFFILVGSYLWKNLGCTMVLWLAGLKAVPGEILDAAKVDGAGKMRQFFLIMLPCLRGSMFSILVVSLLNSFKVFREVYLVGGAYPQKSIYMLQNVFHNWYVNLEQDKLAAGAVMLAVFLGSVSLLLQRLWDREKEA